MARVPFVPEKDGFVHLWLQAAKPDLPGNLRIVGESGPLELQAAAEGESEGAKLRRFKIIAYTGGSMWIAGFYSAPVVVDLSGMSVPNQAIPIFKNHDAEAIVGHSDKVTVKAKELSLEGVISGVGEAAQEVQALASNGFPWQASIGASIQKLEFVEAGQKVSVNGKSFNGPVYVARQTTLGEVSFVPLGADSGSSAKVAAQVLEGVSVMNFSQWLAAKGINETDLTEAVKTILLAQFKAETEKPKDPPNPPGNPPENQPPTGKAKLAAAVNATLAEEERVAGISDLAAATIKASPRAVKEIQAAAEKAIDGGWDIGRASNAIELAAIKASLPQSVPASAPLIMATTTPAVDGKVLEAAVLLETGVPSITASLAKDYGEKTLEAAHKHFKHGIGLQGLIAHCARRNGWSGENVKYDLRAALEAAMMRPAGLAIRAGEIGSSSYSLAGILSNLSNKYLLSGWNAVEQVWPKIAATRSVSDLKTITSYRLNGNLVYEKVPPSGRLNHGTMGETAYTNKANTYAKLLGISREDMINDDLGALSGAGVMLGRGGALKLNLVIWTEFQDDAAFFPVDKSLKNYDDGAVDTALTAVGLDNMTNLFRSQKDPNDNPLGIRPKILLVPIALEGAGLSLMSSEDLNDSDSSMGTANIWRGRYEVVSTDYLTNQKAWYLLAAAADLPVIEVCFLNGQQTPTIETADMDFDLLGIALRGFHDFGVAKQEPKGGVKAKGEA